jgi:iron complex outermembrane recepter protein
MRHMNKLKQTSMLVAVSAAISIVSMPAFAQQNEDERFVEDEIVTIGTRSKKARSVRNSPVPVDVFTGKDFESSGNTVDITDMLKTLVPSYTATPATGDGSAFIRPTSLRGMSPDETLILVNGKRRHRSALVQFFAPAAGNGSHGADVGMIPAIALKSVEVLRDGASAQYGSDAIAGVMNFTLKDSADSGEANIQYGQFYQGEESKKIAANVGLPLGDNGFVNISGEYVDNQALSRGIIRPDAQALINAGVPGVGADSPFGDAPFTQTWGRPQTKGARFFLNSGISLSNNVDLYMFGNYADTDGRYRFFYRNPNHSSIQALRGLGFTGLQAGYTPYLDGAQKDVSLVGGMRGETENGMYFDFSLGAGKNSLDYFLNNTLNPSLGLVNGQPAQRDFNVGGYDQKEISANADFSKAINDSVNVAFGAEWRQETYSITPGEPASFVGSGSNGLNGFKPQDSGSFDRSNYAAYVDVEHDITDKFMVQYAARYERFSDFGNTLNGKIAARYIASENVTLRAAVSTGFKAPTPGQANVRTTITTFDGATGLQVEEGLVPPTSAGALSVGGAPLKEERSTNYSGGIATRLGERTSLTLDAYEIVVKDRIYRTGDIALPSGPPGATISFYTNALTVVSKGIDMVLTSNFVLSDQVDTDISFAGSYNKVSVRSQNPVGGILPVKASVIEDIENNYPNIRAVLSANTHFGDKVDWLIRANFYGSSYDERGTINDPVSPSAKIGSIIYFDTELGYQATDNVRFAVGAVNIFDSFINRIGPPNANRLSVGLQYPRRSAANYEGGSWYAKLTLTY